MYNVKYQTIIHLLILLFFQVTASLAVADEIYRCMVNGKTVFTDQPCDGKRVELLPLNTLPPVDELPEMQQEKPPYNSGKWYINTRGYKTALKVSKKYGVPLFIYYQADWCGYCRKLEDGLLNKYKAKKILRQVVKVRISPEEGKREDALFRRMGGTGYPTILTQTGASASPIKQYLTRNKNGQWSVLSMGEFRKLIERLSK